jgi:hypothetical protein
VKRPGFGRAVFVLTLGALVAMAPACLSGQVDDKKLPWSEADSTVALGGSRIGLRVVAWRDFMPSIGPERAGGSPLMVSLQIVSLEPKPLPDGLTVDSVWVRSPKEVWETAPTSEPRPGLPNGMELILRGGPKWDTDQRIDVLVRLRTADGSAHYLQVRDQRIGRTQ